MITVLETRMINLSIDPTVHKIISMKNAQQIFALCRALWKVLHVHHISLNPQSYELETSFEVQSLGQGRWYGTEV